MTASERARLSTFVNDVAHGNIQTFAGDEMGGEYTTTLEVLGLEDVKGLAATAFSSGVIRADGSKWDEVVNVLSELVANQHAPVAKYDPDQPRDEGGKWTSGGGDGGGDPAPLLPSGRPTAAGVEATHDALFKNLLEEYDSGALKDAVATDITERLMDAGIPRNVLSEGVLAFGQMVETWWDTDEVAYQLADLVVKQWADTSGDTDPWSIGIQRIANELFGDQMPDGAVMNHLLLPRDLVPIADKVAGNEAIRAVVQAQYDATQTYLREQGIEQLTLARGVALTDAQDRAFEQQGVTVGQAVEGDVRLQPLSSFTTNLRIANTFANDAGDGMVLVTTVAARDVFSFPRTGNGCLGEREVVVLGGTRPARIALAAPSATRFEEAFKARLVLDVDAELKNADWPKRTDDTKNHPRTAVAKFDPDQPRDEGGKWTSGGGGEAAGEDAAAAASTPHFADTAVADTALFGQVTDFDLQRAEYKAAVQRNLAAKLAQAGVSRRDLEVGAALFIASGAPNWTDVSVAGRSDEELQNRLCRAVVDQWAMSSGDARPLSIGVQLAAYEQFMDRGLASNATVEHYRVPDQTWATAELVAKNPAVRAVLEAQYEATQAYLAERGISELTLLRGYRPTAADRETGIHDIPARQAATITTQLAPLSSFTTRDDVATGFAEGGRDGLVLMAKVPAREVFSLPFTGNGCLPEREVVVFGGYRTVRAYNWERKPDEEWLAEAMKRADRRRKVLRLDEDLANADWPKRTPDVTADLDA